MDAGFVALLAGSELALYLMFLPRSLVKEVYARRKIAGNISCDLAFIPLAR